MSKESQVITEIENLKKLISNNQIDEEDARFEITNLVDSLSVGDEERLCLMGIVRENQF